jgi:phosphoribosyl-ATP pyrophosphohydrolase/phosphoribosyl-AMP cyclohydrolase
VNLNLDWHKMQGLVPAVVQHHLSGEVLMLGYMNEEALGITQRTGRVTFFSRSKQRLWTKGESSGHFLSVKDMAVDCDADTLLILAVPEGPACHLGTTTCFGSAAPRPSAARLSFLAHLEALVAERQAQRPVGSYTTELFEAGIPRIAQKVGEESVEAALAAVCKRDEELLGEAADLLYHLIVLLRARGLSLYEVASVLERRHARDA